MEYSKACEYSDRPCEYSDRLKDHTASKSMTHTSSLVWGRAWWPLERVVWPLSWSMTGLKSIRAKWGPKVSDSRTGRGRRGVRTRARAVPRSTFRCPMLIARESRPAGRSSAPGSPSRSTGGFGTVWRGDAGSGYGPGEGTCSVGGGRMLSSGAVRTHSGQFSPPPRCG